MAGTIRECQLFQVCADGDTHQNPFEILKLGVGRSEPPHFCSLTESAFRAQALRCGRTEFAFALRGANALLFGIFLGREGNRIGRFESRQHPSIRNVALLPVLVQAPFVHNVQVDPALAEI